MGVLTQGEGLMILIYTLNGCSSTIFLWQTHIKCRREAWLIFLSITFDSDAFLKGKQEPLCHLLDLGVCTRHLVMSQFSRLVLVSPSNHSAGDWE